MWCGAGKVTFNARAHLFLAKFLWPLDLEERKAVLSGEWRGRPRCCIASSREFRSTDSAERRV